MSSSRVPPQKFEYHHRTPIQLRFNDIDMLGHVNNAIYFQYADLSKVAYFGQFMPDGFDPRRVSLVIAHIDCDYFAPIRASDSIAVLTAVASISNSSLILEQRIIDKHEEVKAIVTTTMVNFDPSTGKPTPINEFWRKTLSEYEGRQL